MSQAVRVAVFAAFIVGLVGGSSQASARSRSFPLTRCGPDLSDLCPIHGYFDLAPFQYNLAIFPGCIRWVRVATSYGFRRERVLVCG
jgi:hypothetical protein